MAIRRAAGTYLSALLLYASVNCSAAVGVEAGQAGDCYSACSAFGTWVYGRGWLVPPYKTIDIGNCIQRGLDEVGWEDEANGGNGHFGQSDLVQSAMAETYERILSDDMKSFVGGSNNPSVSTEDVLLTGLNAVSAGATVPNSEGLYYCLENSSSNITAAAFYWVINCGLLEDMESPDLTLCTGLSDEEQAFSQDSTEPVMVGYVLDDDLLQIRGKVFHRYLFNTSHVILTDNQPIAGPTGFECTERPWYTVNWMCQDPTAVTCPTYFVGSSGLGTFQTYGSTDTAVVSQDIRDYQLCVCLEDMPCNLEEREETPSSRMSSVALGMTIGVICFFAVGIICSLRGRTKINRLFNM